MTLVFCPNASSIGRFTSKEDPQNKSVPGCVCSIQRLPKLFLSFLARNFRKQIRRIEIILSGIIHNAIPSAFYGEHVIDFPMGQHEKIRFAVISYSHSFCPASPHTARHSGLLPSIGIAATRRRGHVQLALNVLHGPIQTVFMLLRMQNSFIGSAVGIAGGSLKGMIFHLNPQQKKTVWVP